MKRKLLLAVCLVPLPLALLAWGSVRLFNESRVAILGLAAARHAGQARQCHHLSRG